MHIREIWNQLSPDTRQWLIDNPGSMIIPRTVTAKLNHESGEGGPVDGHGGTLLTEDDREFIQDQARASKDGYAGDPRFFDSVRPED
ncbi:hypothetical protein ABIE18_004112 [Arthrobacter sp. 2762]